MSICALYAHRHYFVISSFILLSLCVKDESSLKMNHVDHIPQTLASHSPAPAESRTRSQHGADMLQPDPRDTFFNSEPLSIHIPSFILFLSHYIEMLCTCTFLHDEKSFASL